MIPLTVAVRHVMRELRKQYPRAIVAKAIRGALLNISTNHQQLLYEAEHPPVPAAGNEGANGRSVARAGR
jgi:hypothetical protein